MVIPERHLGLHMPADETVPPNVVEALAQLVSTHVDLDALLALAATAQLPEWEAGAPEPAGAPPGEQPAAAAQQQHQQQQQQQGSVRIAVARDAAFCFYYQDNLALLREVGCSPGCVCLARAPLLRRATAAGPPMCPHTCLQLLPCSRLLTRASPAVHSRRTRSSSSSRR